jgi:hypothetical protein
LCKRIGISGVTIGCTGGLGVLIIFVDLTGPAPARAGRVTLPIGKRADFDPFFAVARALFALFFAVRRVVFADRPAVFAECLLIYSI